MASRFPGKEVAGSTAVSVVSGAAPQHSGWILSATILTSGLGFFMGSAVNVVLPTIQGYWGLEISLVQWIANAYALTLSAFILLSSALGDIFGVRTVFNAGIVLFTAGAALGPLLGGILAEFDWRLVFWFAVPLGIAASVITRRFVPILRDEQKRRIDWAGAPAVLLGLGGLSYGLVRIPESGMTPFTGAALLVGVAAALLFVPLERRAVNPIVPLAMLDRTVAVANVATVLLYFGFQGTLFVLSFHFQQLLGFSSTLTGLAFLPATAMIALFASSSGRITDRKGPRMQLILGAVLNTTYHAALPAASLALFLLPRKLAGG